MTSLVALQAAECAGASAALEQAVCTATGPLGLLVIWVYSFLVAVILPFPGEIVLVPAEHLRLGLPFAVTLCVIVLVSAVGKVAGSLLAFRIGQGVKRSDPVTRLLRRLPVDVVGWSEKQSVELVQRRGFVGLAVLLSIPGFPDTLPIYAFTFLEEDYVRFAIATFVGTVVRLLVTIGVVGGAVMAT